jgi:trehalose utilization protein
MAKINVTLWNEFRHEKSHKEVMDIYPNGLHKAIGEGLADDAELVLHYAR